MRVTRRKFGNFVKIVALLLLILVLIGAFVAIYKLSNNFTTDLQTFYLVVDGDVIAQDTSVVLSDDTVIRVHTLGDLFSGKKGFDYVIMPRQENNFTFILNGKTYSFLETTDYTDSFSVIFTENTINVQRMSMQKILENTFGVGNYVLPALDATECYFTLVLKSQDGMKSISLDFRFTILMEGLEFGQSHLEF